MQTAMVGGSPQGQAIDGTQAPSRNPSLVELSSELLSLAYSLSTSTDLGDPVEVRKKILLDLDRLETAGRSAGYATHLGEAARFALVALLDETVLSSSWRGKDAWRANPLQREIFKINIAGEEFYTRLEQLRANRAENGPALEVFYACLIMGFEGRYKLLGREKLEALIHSLASELSQGQPLRIENLSPAWKRPDEFHEVVGEGIPIWMTLGGIVVIAILLILIFRAVAIGDARHVADTIHHYLLEAGR